jgi:hypothetical protein
MHDQIQPFGENLKISIFQAIQRRKWIKSNKSMVDDLQRSDPIHVWNKIYRLKKTSLPGNYPEGWSGRKSGFYLVWVN